MIASVLATAQGIIALPSLIKNHYLTCLSMECMPTAGFQGLLSNKLNASPPTKDMLECTICSTKTGQLAFSTCNTSR